MKTFQLNEEQNSNVDNLSKNYAKIAGILFIFTFAISLVYGGILFPKFLAKDVLTTSSNILNNEFLFASA